MAVKELFLIFFLFGLSNCDSSDKCPPSEDIKSCVCKEATYARKMDVNCDWDKLDEQFLEKFRKSFGGKFGIDLTVNFPLKHDAVRLPTNIFDGLDIQWLTILHGNISYWSDEIGGPAFVGLEDSLDTLTLRDCVSYRPDANVPFEEETAAMKLGHLRKLRILAMNKNKFFKFNDEYLQDLESVWLINLSDSNIWILGDNAFSSLSSIRTIVLDGNRIQELKRSMFPNPATELSDLEMVGNRLIDLPDDIFSNMPALRYIDLQNNDIMHLPEQIWKPVWSELYFLVLDGNPLWCNDHIDWVFDVKPPQKLLGRCHGPDKRENKHLINLIEDGKNEN